MGYEGFRKELFGYNKNDVTRFIEQIVRNNEKHVSELNEKIDALRRENEEFHAKSAEIEAEMEKARKLSAAIGRLYVISQANAAAVMRAAQNNARACRRAADKGIEGVTVVQSGIDDAGRKMSDIMAELTRKIEQISASLDEARSSLETSVEQLDNVAGEDIVKEAECR